MGRAGTDAKKLIEIFWIYLEEDGNIAAVSRSTGHTWDMINKYRQKHDWDQYLERIRKIKQEAITTALSVTKEGHLKELIDLKDDLGRRVKKKNATGSLVANYLKVLHSIAELKGWVAGPDNPDTISELKLKKLMDSVKSVIIQIIKSIPGGDEFIKKNPDVVNAGFEQIIEAL